MKKRKKVCKRGLKISCRKRLLGHTDNYSSCSVMVKGPFLFYYSPIVYWLELDELRHSSRLPLNICTSYPRNETVTYTNNKGDISVRLT